MREARKHKRMPVNLSCMLKCADSPTPVLATVLDVSFGGIGIVAKPLLAGFGTVHDLKTAAALLLAIVLAAGAAALRVVVPLALVYGNALGVWLFSRLTF